MLLCVAEGCSLTTPSSHPPHPTQTTGRAAVAPRRKFKEPESTDEPSGLQRPAFRTASIKSESQSRDVQSDDVQGIQGLRLKDAQCAAARNSPLADALLKQRRQILQQGCERPRLESAAKLAAALLACQATQERNDAAASAVQLFITLGQLQRQRVVLDDIYSVLDESATAMQRIREAGVDVDADPTELPRQVLGLREQRIDLEHGVERAAQSLNLQMGRRRLDDIPTILVDLGADRTLVDVEQAVADGLACRAELAQLRILLRCVQTDNLETAKQLIALVEPALAAVLKSQCECFRCWRCIVKCDDCCDVARLRSQVQELYEAALSLAESDLANKAIQVNQAVRQLDVSEQKLAIWSQRETQLKRLAENDSSHYSSWLAARVSRLRARSTVIASAAMLDAARARLLDAQGMLAAQCGFRNCCAAHCVPPEIASPRVAAPVADKAIAAVPHVAARTLAPRSQSMSRSETEPGIQTETETETDTKIETERVRPTAEREPRPIPSEAIELVVPYRFVPL